MSAPGRLSLFHRPLKRRLNSAFAVMAAPQSSPQHFSSAKVAIETAVKTQKEEGGKDKGWPLSVKLVGIGIVAVVPPSALKYAIENDWETRNAVEKWIPGGVVLVERLRQRHKDRHFWDENLKILQRNAKLSELYVDDKVLKLEVLCSNGQSSCVVLKATDGTAGLEKIAGCPGRIVNMVFLDDDITEEQQHIKQVEAPQDENSVWSSAVDNSQWWSDIVSLANTKSWWDRCRSSEEHLLSPDTGLSYSFSQSEVKEDLSAKEVSDVLESMAKEVQELENEKFNGTRSIDDIEADIATNKQKQAELKSKISPWWRKLFS